jgi:hypothetical protein
VENSTAKLDLLYSVLAALHRASVLKECVLIGSWCQDIYRQMYGNPFQIPAATTTDADLLVPRRMRNAPKVNIADIMEQCGFKIERKGSDGLMKFIHEDFKFEFLTDTGAQADETVYLFKNLSLSTQQLHFLNIPLAYSILTTFRDIPLRVPEPEAFALHKLIVSQRRRKPEKREKDIAAARGLFEYFQTKPHHAQRLHAIFQEFPKGWQKRVQLALLKTGLELPD